MTISKKAIYGDHHRQVMQDLYSNIEVLKDFIASQKAKLLASTVSFQFTDDGAEPDLIDMVVAENAAASIHTLVIAEINGGYRYPDDEEVVEHDDETEGTYEDLVAKRDALVAKESALKARAARASRRA